MLNEDNIDEEYKHLIRQQIAKNSIPELKPKNKSYLRMKRNGIKML